MSESVIRVKSMQISGTEAIRTQIQPSKPKREITKIRNCQNTKRTYGQPSEHLVPKRLLPQQNYRLGTVSNELLGGGAYQNDSQQYITMGFTCIASPSVSEVVQNI